MTHADRFTKLTALTKGSHNNDPFSYHAAFYLLSHDPDVCAAACRFISMDGISFTGLKRAVRDFDDRTRQVVDIAHSLFSWHSPCRVTPFQLSRLGYPYMELVCNACYIAAGEFRVVIEPGKAEITLDDRHYQESKRINRQLEQVERTVTADMIKKEAVKPKREKSMRFNAMEEDFEEVTIFDKPALFTSLRIGRNTVPRGYHLYEVRHDDDCQGDAVQLARGIMVNHWGSLITRDEIKLPADGYLDLNPEDLNYATGDCQSMKEFMEKYPPKAKPPKSYER